MSNGNGGDGGAAGGKGKSAGSSLADQIASTVGDVLKVIQDLGAIDDLTSRSVVCEIDNVCGQALNFDTSNFDHGGFGQDLPPPSIGDKGTGLFSARSSGFLVGVEGRVTYDLNDGAGSKFTVHFDNPEIGGNSSDCSVDGSLSNTYWTKSITGNGNNGAHMRYILGHLNPPFSLRTFLNNTKPTGFDPSAPSTSLRGLQAGTSVKSFMKV